MSSTSYNGDKLLRPFLEGPGGIKSHHSCNPDPISMRNAIRPGKSFPHYRRLGFEIYQPMCSASWRDDSHTFRKCNKTKIGGGVHVDRARMLDFRMAQQVVALFPLPGPTQLVCQYLLRVVVNKAQEGVPMVQ